MASDDVNHDRLLEAALNGSAATPLPDQGFSERVLRMLPRPASRRPWYAVDGTQVTLWAAAFAILFVILRQSSVDAEVGPLFQTLNEVMAGLWGPLGIATAVLACLSSLGGWSEKSRD
jgi:hypothetical protein